MSSEAQVTRGIAGAGMPTFARSGLAQGVVTAVLLALFAFAIFGPLSNLLLWAFAEKWYFPSKLPSEFGFSFWQRVFNPRGAALVGGFAFAGRKLILTLNG